MELGSISTKKKANSGAFLHLVHPGTGELLYDYDDTIEDVVEREKSKKAVGLHMMGSDSDLFQSMKNKGVNDVIFSRNKKKQDPKTIEQINDDGIKLLADMTLGWENISYNGDSKFSKETIYQVYSDPGWKWIRDQANLFADDRANFI